MATQEQVASDHTDLSATGIQSTTFHVGRGKVLLAPSQQQMTLRHTAVKMCEPQPYQQTLLCLLGT